MRGCCSVTVRAWGNVYVPNFTIYHPLSVFLGKPQRVEQPRLLATENVRVEYVWVEGIPLECWIEPVLGQLEANSKGHIFANPSDRLDLHDAVKGAVDLILEPKIIMRGSDEVVEGCAIRAPLKRVEVALLRYLSSVLSRCAGDWSEADYGCLDPAD